MNIIEQVFAVSHDVQNAFLEADAELKLKGEVSPEAQNRIDQLLANQEQVATELCNWYLRTEGKLSALEAEYQPILDKIKDDFAELQNDLERIEGFISLVLPKDADTQIANESVYAFWKHTEAVDVVDESIVPIEFVEYVPKVSKEAIKQVLRTGADVPGAKLKDNYSLQVKMGGLKAIKNAAKRIKSRGA